MVERTLKNSLEFLSRIEDLEARAERAEKIVARVRALSSLPLRASAARGVGGVELIAFIAEDWRRAIADAPPIYAITGSVVRPIGPVS